jgi:serine/threonine-protein kinase RsbT
MGPDLAEAAVAAAITIATEADLIHVRQVLRAAAVRAGLGLVDQTKIVTAGSELARNILTYATGARGRMLAEQVSKAGRTGIADVDAALTDGYSTAGSLGLGLPGSRRLVDQMEIATSPAGTTVVVVKWKR